MRNSSCLFANDSRGTCGGLFLHLLFSLCVLSVFFLSLRESRSFSCSQSQSRCRRAKISRIFWEIARVPEIVQILPPPPPPLISLSCVSLSLSIPSHRDRSFHTNNLEKKNQSGNNICFLGLSLKKRSESCLQVAIFFLHLMRASSKVKVPSHPTTRPSPLAIS